MTNGYATQAVQAVLNSLIAFCKFLSSNDTGATGGHQAGILISTSAKEIMFNEDITNENILKKAVEIQWQDGSVTQSTFTYYKSKHEFRITKFGRNFPFLNPEYTGALFILIKRDARLYTAYLLETEEEIEYFLNSFNISPTETNRLIDTGKIPSETKEALAIQEFIQSLTVDFPPSEIMASAAREIQNRVYNHLEYIRTNPDRKIIEWTETEYSLFRALEHFRYGDKITSGFSSVEEFITMANMVLNRRKSRAGKSLEHHLVALFDGNGLAYTTQATTEGHKKPDFLFPSQEAYHNSAFPTEKLISLAAKTTCKDRWRQIINEADRLRDKPKFLCTLQQGISPMQMDEMHAENVLLVVPKPYITAYPEDRRDRIWTLAKFIAFVRETEGLQS